MTEIAEVRQRVLATIERARQEASERRARSDVAEAQGRRFIEDTATPVARQVASVLKVEGFQYRLSTPAGSVRLVSATQHDDFIELAVDATQDPVTIMTRVSHARGKRGLCTGDLGPRLQAARPEAPMLGLNRIQTV
ncbi:MAG: hypothetical protein QF681_14175 [Vicinamibacterales bacterium]|nr:hypothetical protein [Vicinamibacterales bacterium]